jgi:hypothetical protein
VAATRRLCSLVIAIAAMVVSVPTVVLVNELEKLLSDINSLEQNGGYRDALSLARKLVADAETTPDRSAAVVVLTRTGYDPRRWSGKIKRWRHGAKKGIEHEDVRVYFNSFDAREPFDREVCGPAAVRSADA